MVVAFNMDLFDEAGIPYPDPQKWMTWDEIIELGKQLTIDLDGRPATDPKFDPTRVKQYGFIADRGHGRQTYIWSNNAEIIEADLSCPVDTPEFIEAMNWLADLGLKHYVGPSPAYEQATTMDIRSKNVAIQHIGVWLLGRINDAGVTRWGTFQVPYSKTKASYGHYSPLCISSKSKYKQESYDFISFACLYEGEEILVDMGMMQPIRKDLRDRFINNPAPPEPKYRQVFYDAFEGPTFRWPGDKVGSYYNGWYQPMIDLWAPYLDSLWAGEIRWEDVAKEVREKTEHLMRTGEVT
jgi:multiple sugar transport system substrate-binding protein